MKRIYALLIVFSAVLPFTGAEVLAQTQTTPPAPAAASAPTSTAKIDRPPSAEQLATTRSAWADLLRDILLAAFVSALVAGLFLLGGFYYTRQLDRKREEEKAWQRIGMPVINAADDLVARIFDLIVRGRSVDFEAPLPTQVSTVFDPPRSLSTVWRLMHLFAASSYLEQHAADDSPRSKTALLRHYANNKARIPLKGNVYRSAKRLQTEGQQLIGSKTLSLAETREIRDVDFYRFLQRLGEDTELQQSADACRGLLAFSTDLTNVSPQLLAVAHFTIHLIDMVQDLRPSGKWEEFRLFLVLMLRSHNRRSAGRASYLYQRGDLDGPDYLATYNFLPEDKRKPRRRAERITRRAREDHPREISSTGVTRTFGQDRVVIKFDDSPGDALQKLKPSFGQD